MKYEVVEGQTVPVDAVLKTDGVVPPVAMDGSALLELFASDGTPLTLAGVTSITDINAWTVRFSPSANDFVEGVYEGRWKLTDGGGKVAYFPDGVADEWVIRKPGGLTINSLVSTQAVASYMGMSAASPIDIERIEANLSMAHSLVAGAIGTTSLFQRAVREKIKVPFDLDYEGLVELQKGPLAMMTGMAVSGTDLELDSSGLNEGLTLNPWSFGLYDGITGGSELVVDYLAGWTAATVPAAIADAIIMTAAILFNHPDARLVSEHIGDWSITYAQTEQEQGVNSVVCLQLREYTRARL